VGSRPPGSVSLPGKGGEHGSAEGRWQKSLKTHEGKGVGSSSQLCKEGGGKRVVEEEAKRMGKRGGILGRGGGCL